MANPAPTINQINAFNATQGTIIDFNIIGGTELVRSNRIYIYDLSDNSLICTHLYVSTESIHELPANTDSSIVYESGKSSADFVNGAQYYAQIQTYTDTAGTEGGSGLSVAKMFWCLVDPTLTITTIPSTISTTSYNILATYNANTSVVSNIIQQYQFSLYSATGSLLQSSGVVVGSGTQQGTSTAYDISYNFTGLSVGSSYYIVVDVTTTQGMSVSTQSNTFTVSIDTPTLGEATVVNNACDGYISVTSNLSSEYGGSASGEIATFVTDSVNDVSSLKVTLTPQQDGTPWIGTDHDTTPYLNRAMPTQSNDYNRESGVIVGGTVAWNQLVPTASRDYINAGTESYSSIMFFFRLNASPYTQFYSTTRSTTGLFAFVKKATATGKAEMIHNSIRTQMKFANNIDVVENHYYLGMINFTSLDASTVGGVVAKDIQLIDLTAMFGSTIADYIYSLEQATAGAGVAWFRNYFPNDYYPYDPGTLRSVEGVSAHETVGFNQWDEEWENGWWNYQTGVFTASSSYFACKSKIAVFQNTEYYWKCPTNVREIQYYDANGEPLGRRNSYAENYTNTTFTTPDGCYYLTFYFGASYGTTYNHDICINLSDPTRNGEYEPYTKHTYPLDSSLTLRGVPKLADGKLAYDGDIYPPSGEVQRRYGVVDLGTLNWSAYNGKFTSALNPEPLRKADGNINMICAKYTTGTFGSSASQGDKKIWLSASTSSATLYVEDSDYSDATTFKTAMSGVYLVYELATPTTETAQAYTNPQIVDPDGTEEYVTANYVPVGHDSTYSLVCPISGYDNVSAVISPTTSASDGQTYTADLPQTVYGGTVDLVSGVLTVDRAMVDLGTLTWSDGTDSVGQYFKANIPDIKPAPSATVALDAICSAYPVVPSNNVVDGSIAVSSGGGKTVYARDFRFSDVASFTTGVNGVQFCYPLATPQTYQLTPVQVQTLLGQNNVWSDAGDVEITYNIPITNLLVKRQDVADVSGAWLTLYSQPVTQASDMDFTFIDFLNQYGKTYKYALVPLLTQTQSGVEVEVEGGYTVSDEVQSIFDGVFIADSTGSQKCKANVGYGDVDMNQVVGTITPIGAKYPVVITNSKNQYHNGSITGTIVPDDYYSNGNLSRIDMVNKRNELEQFLTNKRAKIIKDWNSNIWLVMIMDNVTCTFNNEYGMGIVNFNANWIEVGDPTNQQDLQATGLIDVGGV